MSYSQEQWQAWQKRLQEQLSPARYRHSLGVAQAAADLAKIYNCDIDKARLAGLLHDIARDLQPSQLIEQAKLYNLPISADDLLSPLILHAPLGAKLAELSWGIKDSEILAAISYHTIPDIKMSDLAKIVFIADSIEPGRSDFAGLELIRQTAAIDLNQTIILILADGFEFLKAKNRPIHPKSLQVYRQMRININ